MYLFIVLNIYLKFIVMKNLKLKKEIITGLNRNSMRKLLGGLDDTVQEDLRDTLEKCETQQWCESGDCIATGVCDDTQNCPEDTLEDCNDTDF